MHPAASVCLQPFRPLPVSSNIIPPWAIPQGHRWTDIHNNIYRMVPVIFRSRLEYPKIIQPGYRVPSSTLPLFVFWILTDNSNPALSLDDFAFVTHGLNR
jgi:hypothetical protein